jgi:hypothetical protein
MSGRQSQQQLLVRDEIVAAPVLRACEDQSFELPAGIYVAMGSMFSGFVAVLALAFRGGHMAVVYGVIFAFIVAFFAVPTMFPGMAGDRTSTKALSWFEFSDRGIATETGRANAREATILVLLLPFLILCFGIAVAAITLLIR